MLSLPDISSLHQGDLRSLVLLDPIRRGADSLKIISGYATHTMASWHIKEIETQNLPPINITLIVGMCSFDGITRDVHEGFKSIVTRTKSQTQSDLTCQYVIRGMPVHSKLYLWEQDRTPLCAFVGSANYTQTAFSKTRRELIQECHPFAAWRYYNAIEPDTMYCTHSEIEDHVTLVQKLPALAQESSPLVSLKGCGVESITLSLLSRSKKPGTRSGLNWGQREGREPNEAYIPLPAEVARTGFFPLEKRHFSVLTDDSKQLILRVEQQNDKAITTPLNNSLIGEYFRNRLGLANGSFVTLESLLRYGRTDVTFYKLDEEQFLMDFSV